MQTCRRVKIQQTDTFLTSALDGDGGQFTPQPLGDCLSHSMNKNRLGASQSQSG